MGERLRKLRLWVMNWPVVSLVLWRWFGGWWVLYGSEVVDVARTQRVAERRAMTWLRGIGFTATRWNSVTVERIRSPHA